MFSGDSAASLRNTAAQLDSQGHSLHKRISDLRNFIRVGQQYRISIKTEVHTDLLKLEAELRANIRARAGLRMQATAMEERTREARKRHLDLLTSAGSAKKISSPTVLKATLSKMPPTGAISLSDDETEFCQLAEAAMGKSESNASVRSISTLFKCISYRFNTVC